MAATAENTYERTNARRTSGTAVDENTYERTNDDRIFTTATPPVIQVNNSALIL